MTSALTYVFCLVRSAKRPAIRQVSPTGFDGGPVRALDCGQGLWLIAANVEAGRFDEAALARGLQDLDWVGRRALAHEEVVESFLRTPALLPMQLFTLFRSDERAIEHVVRDRRRITAILDAVGGRVEWGIRVTFDEKSSRDAVEKQHAQTRRARGDSITDGVAYLARKRDLLNVNRVQLTAARREADRLFKTMSRAASDASRRTATEQAAPGSRLLLDAAFLVPHKDAAAFRSALRREMPRLRAAGLAVALTGPWPPYNFIDHAPARRRRRPSKKTGKRTA